MTISSRKKQDLVGRAYEISTLFVICMVMLTVAFISQVKFVVVETNGNTLKIPTVACDVKTLVSSIGDTNDKTVNLLLNTEITDGLKVSVNDTNIVNANNNTDMENIVYNSQKIVERQESIPYEVEQKDNPRSYTRKVIQQGQIGQKTIVVKELYNGSEKVGEEIIDEIVVTNPVNEIIENGTMMDLSSRSGAGVNRNFEYSSSVIMSPTYYDLCKSCCGKSSSSPGYGMTASGYRIIPGQGAKVIAVDPNTIPLGSRVYVESLVPGVPDYGYALAADTGGAIHGNRVDLYVDSHDLGRWSGKNTVKVYILK